MLPKLPVICQIVRRIIRGAQGRDAEALNQPLGAKIIRIQHAVGRFPNLRRRIRVQNLFNAKHAPKFQVRPMIERIADQHGHRLGKGHEPRLIVGSADKGVVKAVGAHPPPFIVVAAQHQMPDVAKADILRDLPGRKVAVVVQDGHVLGKIVVKTPRSRRGQQKVFIHKGFHSKSSLFMASATSAVISERSAPHISAFAIISGSVLWRS